MKSLLVVAVLSLSSASFAQQHISTDDFFGAKDQLGSAELNVEALERALNLDGAPMPIHGGSCGKIALTEEQQGKLKAAFIALKRTTIQDKADLEIAKLDYLVTISDAKSTKAVATTNSVALSDAAAAIMQSYLSFTNDVLYDILTADQRGPALACMGEMHHFMKAAAMKKACAKFGPKKPDHKKGPGPIDPNPPKN